ncbi:MAG: aspartate--tRNA ligase [Chlamydiales bacterium]
MQRTHTCGDLNITDKDKIVVLTGWVHSKRNLGKLLFIDLRDKYGITQLVFNSSQHELVFNKALTIHHEWVILIKGIVLPRGKNDNTNKKTGTIEIEVNDLIILSESETPPFPMDQKQDVHENLRLRYRYLDIRRGAILQNLQLRHTVMQLTRAFLSKNGFIEITTPILARSTPEGARDYLVPSRTHPGNFFALPQSPQLFKQLCMIAGMDRYFQIATCFRDEDLRSDRQPEFTQIDMEMSFSTTDNLQNIIEKLMKEIWFLSKQDSIDKHWELKIPFQRITYKDAMESYGTDRPDLRLKTKWKDGTEIAQKSSFTHFHQAITSKYHIKMIRIPGGNFVSRKTLDQLPSSLGLASSSKLYWMKYENQQFTSSIIKFFPIQLQRELELSLDLKKNDADIILFLVGQKPTIYQDMHLILLWIKELNNLDQTDEYKFCWVTDFPLFLWDETTGRYSSVHHPFTAPKSEDIHKLESDPLSVRAEAYDLVLNGHELGGGSQRIHNPKLQNKIFTLLNLNENSIQEKFGFFIEALQYGTPPHLGIALGLDRLMMLLCRTKNIRDVIAFPKTQQASDLMTECPNQVDPNQLKELKIFLDRQR